MLARTPYSRRTFLAALAASRFASASTKPNIVVIVADDLGWGDISANGCPDIRTPHIDAIAKGGVRFTQSYASAPECTPTRCALLTGNYPQRAGGLECAIGVNNLGRYDEAEWLQHRGELGLPATGRTLPHLLKRQGYETACVGKWHLGYLAKFLPDQHGFDHWFSVLGGNADYYTHEEQGEGSGKSNLFENGRKVDRSGYMTDLIAQSATDWLKARSSKPYLLYLAFTAPHTPIQAAEDFDPTTGTAPHRNRDRATYVRMVERLDARIGDVLAQIKTDNTIVIFTSDNGADANGRNDPFRGRKSSLFEGGIRAPLHIRWPGTINPGIETPQVAATMDLAPTLLAAVGAPHQGFDGHDLLPVITGRKPVYDRTIYWRYRRGQITRKAVRHGHWKYINDAGAESLYNLEEDASEQKDVLGVNAALTAELKKRLADWEMQVASPRLRDFRPQRSLQNG